MALQMAFEVGTTEKHTVTVNYDKFWGGFTIAVDGNSVVSKTLFVGVDLVKSYRFPVGTTEVHEVQIDHHRKQFFAGFREQVVVAYIDGVHVTQGVA